MVVGRQIIWSSHNTNVLRKYKLKSEKITHNNILFYMKCLLILFALLSFSFANGQSSPATQVATKVSQKMKDSLLLTDAQKDLVYEINMQLHFQKANVWGQSLSDSIRRVEIQKVENTRDSLYKPVLSEQQYQQYKQMKRNLVSNN